MCITFDSLQYLLFILFFYCSVGNFWVNNIQMIFFQFFKMYIDCGNIFFFMFFFYLLQYSSILLVFKIYSQNIPLELIASFKMPIILLTVSGFGYSFCAYSFYVNYCSQFVLGHVKLVFFTCF